MGIVVGMVATMGVLIVFLPCLTLSGDLRVDVSVLVYEVHALVDVDDDVKEQIHTAPRLENGGNHGNTKQLPQFVEIDVVAAALSLVIHVESAYHTHVHVHQLGRKVKVALQIAGIYHIDHHIGWRLDDLLAYIQFLGTIGRKRIGAWKVNKVEFVALVMGMPFLGVNRHSRVVAHTLMGS